MSLTDLSNECPRSRKILPLAPVLEMMGPKFAFLRSPGLDSASLPRRPRSGPALRLVLGRGANTHAPCAPRNGGPVARSGRHSAQALGFRAGLPKERFVQSVACAPCADLPVETCGEGPGRFQTAAVNGRLQDLTRTEDPFAGLPLPLPVVQPSVAGRGAPAGGGGGGGQPTAAQAEDSEGAPLSMPFSREQLATGLAARLAHESWAVFGAVVSM